MIGVLPAAAAAPTKVSTSAATVAVLFWVNQRPWGTFAIRSRMTAARESPGLAATQRAALVCGSTKKGDSAAEAVPGHSSAVPATTAAVAVAVARDLKRIRQLLG